MVREYAPEYVKMDDVPVRRSSALWRKRFQEIPDGKAVMLRCNNRQRAHQLRASIRNAASYHRIKVKTRVIHAEPAIHGTDGWLLYFWKPDED